MDFCPDCESILYLTIEDKQLANKCRQCGYINPSVENKCVYNHNFEQDSLENTYNILNNKYTIKDPTLPRLTNIDCINDDCLTKEKNSILIINSDNLKLEEFKDKINTLIPGLDVPDFVNIEKNNLFDYGELHLNNSYYNPNELIKIKKLVYKNDISTIEPLLFDNNILLNNNFGNDFIIDINKDIPIVSFIKKQIVFIKYDSKNMKYMYICSTCGTSWKNIN